jgi:hydroxymethylbilane synthase
MLASAGLIRLGMAGRITQELGLEVSIPAVAQGVLAIEIREPGMEPGGLRPTGGDDDAVRDLVRAAIHDEVTAQKVAAERSFLAKMGGSCQTPLAAHAVPLPHDHLRVYAMCGMPDGSRILKADVTGPVEQAVTLGNDLADLLLAQGAGEILAATKI